MPRKSEVGCGWMRLVDLNSATARNIISILVNCLFQPKRRSFIYSEWPDLAIYCTLGNFQNPWQQLICPNCPHYRQFFKGVKIFHFSSEIIFGQLLYTFGNFFWSHWLCLTSLFVTGNRPTCTSWKQNMNCSQARSANSYNFLSTGKRSSFLGGNCLTTLLQNWFDIGFRLLLLLLSQPLAGGDDYQIKVIHL